MPLLLGWMVNDTLHHPGKVYGTRWYCKLKLAGKTVTHQKTFMTIFKKSSADGEMGNRLATIDMGRKVGELMCPFLGGASSPYNTMWPGPRPTLVPSGILIHSAVWPQYTNITDSSDRHDRQRSDSNRANPFINGCPKTDTEDAHTTSSLRLKLLTCNSDVCTLHHCNVPNCWTVLQPLYWCMLNGVRLYFTVSIAHRMSRVLIYFVV